MRCSHLMECAALVPQRLWYLVQLCQDSVDATASDGNDFRDTATKK